MIKTIMLLDAFNNNESLINKKTINYIVMKEIKENNLKEYLNSVKFKLLQNSRAEYNKKSKTITFDYNQLVSDYDKISNDKAYNIFNQKELITLINLVIIKTIYHELYHVKQTKIQDIYNRNYIENTLINLHPKKSFIYQKIKNNNLSKRQINYFRKIKKQYTDNYYHDLIPFERMANIRSFQQVYILSHAINTSDKVRKFVKYNYYAQLLRGYQENNTPIETYLNYNQSLSHKCQLHNLDKEKRELKDHELVDYLSLEERMFYGLTINEKEYVEMVNKTKQLIR